MTTRRTRVAGVLVFGGFLAVVGVRTALANSYTADADCAGLTVSIPRTEDGTIVTAYRNGVAVRTVTNDVFGAPVSFTVASPDPTVAQAWRVVIDSRWNDDQTFTETVPACVTPTSSSTTTTPPSSTVVPTSTVATTEPPAPPSSTVVVTTPRPTTTTTGAPPVFELPETGGEHGDELAVGLTLLAAGAGLVVAARRRGDVS